MLWLRNGKAGCRKIRAHRLLTVELDFSADLIVFDTAMRTPPPIAVGGCIAVNLLVQISKVIAMIAPKVTTAAKSMGKMQLKIAINFPFNC
jgi:hypothetical protein